MKHNFGSKKNRKRNRKKSKPGQAPAWLTFCQDLLDILHDFVRLLHRWPAGTIRYLRFTFVSVAAVLTSLFHWTNQDQQDDLGQEEVSTRIEKIDSLDATPVPVSEKRLKWQRLAGPPGTIGQEELAAAIFQTGPCAIHDPEFFSCLLEGLSPEQLDSLPEPGLVVDKVTLKTFDGQDYFLLLLKTPTECSFEVDTPLLEQYLQEELNQGNERAGGGYSIVVVENLDG